MQQQPTRESVGSLPSDKQGYVSETNHSLSTTSKSSMVTVLRSLNWPKTIFLVGIPLAATVSLHWVPLRKETFWAGLIYAYLRALAVTAGGFSSHYPPTVALEKHLINVPQAIIASGHINLIQPAPPSSSSLRSSVLALVKTLSRNGAEITEPIIAMLTPIRIHIACRKVSSMPI